MRLTVLGCSGSVAGPDSPASGYLLTAHGMGPLVMDFGPGVLGALQRHADPSEVSVLLSHLHADHCLDLPGLLVWRRYHPSARGGRAMVLGPSDTSLRIGAASSEVGGEVDDWSDTIDMRAWDPAAPVRFGNVTVAVTRVDHPAEAYAMRFASDLGRSLVYTGDTAYSDHVVEFARGADLLLAEASWTHDPANRPPHLHMSGTEAGRLAARAGARDLLLTHIPPWTSREDVIAEAKAEFSGPVHAVSPGESFEV